MKRTLMAVVCLLGFAVASTACADMINGQYVPHDLVGQKDANGNYVKYRLIFVTAGTNSATSSDPAVYDDFVRAEANRMGSVFEGQNSLYNWTAVVTTGTNYSTPTRTAASVLNTNGTLPVYNVAGELVGANAAAMLNWQAGQPNAAVLTNDVGFNQFASPSGNAVVWTGSKPTGAPAYVPGGQGFTLGSTSGSGAYGMAGQKTGAWLGVEQNPGNPSYLPFQVAGQPLGFAIYAISGELSAIPEPSTIVMWSVCAGVAGLAVWRKRRKTN